ncbi:MAG: response regulator transcription factor [Lachnospiraceae bacterium]
MRILLVEDEKRLADALGYMIKKNHFAVDVAFDGISGQDMAESGIYDLIILDRMLPERDGVKVLRQIRAKGIGVPVIFLTARDSIENRVEGLDAGADDYLIKPFSTEELMARIRALTRRRETLFVGEKTTLGRLSIEPQKLEATVTEEVVRLSVKEMQLLELLLLNAGQVLTKEQIFERIWGFDSETDISSVELYIHYLRKKIPGGKAGVEIRTVRGVGYMMMEADNVS